MSYHVMKIKENRLKNESCQRIEKEWWLMTFRPLPPAFTLWNLWNHNLKDAAKRSHACFFCLWHQQQRCSAQEKTA